MLQCVRFLLMEGIEAGVSPDDFAEMASSLVAASLVAEELFRWTDGEFIGRTNSQYRISPLDLEKADNHPADREVYRPGQRSLRFLDMMLCCADGSIVEEAILSKFGHRISITDKPHSLPQVPHEP
jgi:hypothetical protein